MSLIMSGHVNRLPFVIQVSKTIDPLTLIVRGVPLAIVKRYE